MTRLALAVALAAVACGPAGCAAVGGRSSLATLTGDVESVGFAPRPTGVETPYSAAAADSLTLRFTAPRFGSLGCGSTRDTLHDPVTVAVLRLKGQAPAWRPGCEASVACWDSVRRQTTPDTVRWLTAMPGVRCSVRVAAVGEWVVVARNGRGWSCWSNIVAAR